MDVEVKGLLYLDNHSVRLRTHLTIIRPNCSPEDTVCNSPGSDIVLLTFIPLVVLGQSNREQNSWLIEGKDRVRPSAEGEEVKPKLSRAYVKQ
jgi:hypothetical protein